MIQLYVNLRQQCSGKTEQLSFSNGEVLTPTVHLSFKLLIQVSNLDRKVMRSLIREDDHRKSNPTSGFRYVLSNAVHSSESVNTLFGSRFDRIVPANRTGSWGITDIALNEISFFLHSEEKAPNTATTHLLSRCNPMVAMSTPSMKIRPHVNGYSRYNTFPREDFPESKTKLQ